MKLKLDDLDLSFGQNYDVSLMDIVLDELQTRYRVKVKKKINGIDQSYWDLKINGLPFCLHYEHYLGVSLYYRSWFRRTSARKLLNDILSWSESAFAKVHTE